MSLTPTVRAVAIMMAHAASRTDRKTKTNAMTVQQVWRVAYGTDPSLHADEYVEFAEYFHDYLAVANGAP